jgi:O-antigen/teichoic acid export membrane protein
MEPVPATTATPPIAALGVHTFVSRVLVFASGFAGSVMISRALGPGGRGAYVLPIVLITMATTLVGPGGEVAQLRLWSHRAAGHSAFVGAALRVGAGLGLGAMAALGVVFALGHDGFLSEVQPEDLAIVIWLVPLWTTSVLLRGLLTISGGIVSVNRALVIGDLARTGAIAVLAITGVLTRETALALFALTVLVPTGLILRQCLRRLGRGPGADARTLARRELRLVPMFAPHFLLLSLNLRVDTLLVASGLGVADLGLYSVAVLLSELAWLVSDALTQAVRERQANAAQEEALAVSARAARVNVLLAGGVALGIAAVSAPLCSLLFGASFAAAAPVVWVLAPAAIAMAAWRPLNAPLVRFDRRWVTGAIGLVSLTVNVVGNLALIPALGIEGAGLASVASYGCGALLAGWRFARLHDGGWRDLVPRPADVATVARLLHPAGPLLRRAARGAEAG